jgi:hypothetical protein
VHLSHARSLFLAPHLVERERLLYCQPTGPNPLDHRDGFRDPWRDTRLSASELRPIPMEAGRCLSLCLKPAETWAFHSPGNGTGQVITAKSLY